MTAEQLIQLLQKLPPYMPVRIAVPHEQQGWILCHDITDMSDESSDSEGKACRYLFASNHASPELCD